MLAAANDYVEVVRVLVDRKDVELFLRDLVRDYTVLFLL